MTSIESVDDVVAGVVERAFAETRQYVEAALAASSDARERVMWQKRKEALLRLASLEVTA